MLRALPKMPGMDDLREQLRASGLDTQSEAELARRAFREPSQLADCPSSDDLVRTAGALCQIAVDVSEHPDIKRHMVKTARYYMQIALGEAE